MIAHTVTPYTLYLIALIALYLIPIALLEHFLKRSYILFIKTPKPYLAGLVVFLVGMVLTQYAAYQRYLISKESERQDIVQETNTVQDQLKTALSYSLSAAKTLAFIVEEYGVPEDFNRVAAEILESNKFIDALELTSRGTITHVYPMEGNEQAIGYDILANPVNAAGAYKAIEKKELFFSGPLELRQGGVAVVGRLPIFRKGEFQGFSVVLIRLETLLKAAGIHTIRSDAFAYKLSKVNPVTGREEFFLANPSAFERSESVSIQVPNGEWKLYVTRRDNKNYYDAMIFSLFGLALSITGGFFALSLAKRPFVLKRLVKEKTIQLATSEKYYRSLIEKSSDAIVLLDATGQVIYQSPSTEKITGYSHQEIRDLDRQMLVHPDDREEDSILFRKLLAEPGLCVYRSRRFRHKSGHYIWLEGTYTNLLHHEYINAIVCNFDDVSLRVESEQKVILANRQLESIINSLPGIFYLYDRTGKFLRWNKNFEEVTGYSSEEISKMHPLDFFEGAEKEIVARKISTVFELGYAEVQAYFSTKDRSRIAYYFNGCRASLDGMDYLMGMGIDITDRVKSEREMRERTEEIRKLTAHLQDIREEERKRIAREIHDELGQQLTGLKMDASWIGKKLNGADRNIHEKLSAMISLIDETVKTVRRISSELRPGVLDDLGLVPALEWQCQEFERRTGINTEFHSDDGFFNLEKNLSTNIFRVYQEALTNVARHASATLVESSLSKSDQYVRLIVKDNGVGFSMEEAKAKKSLGLIGMRERAHLFHGELTIESGKQSGTTIILKVPVSEGNRTIQS